MAVTLRMTRHGRKKVPFYRIVATEHTSKRDGKFIEIVGHYNPRSEPVKLVLKEDRVKYWIGVGAQTSLAVRNLISKTFPGLVEDRAAHKLEKVQAARKKRKARQKKLAKK